MRNKFCRVCDPNTFCTCSGSPEKVDYARKVNSDGTISLRECRRLNIQNEINSHREECDMAVILHKLRYGDTSVLTHKKPIYADFTQFPQSYAECLDLVHRSEDAFNSLDPAIKQKFDNSKEKWFASIGSDFWMKEMGFVPVDSLVDPDKEPTD